METKFLVVLNLLFILAVSCSTNVEDPHAQKFNLELDARLIQNLDGFNELILVRSSFQTTHRISGRLTQNGGDPEPPLRYIGWESSHSWVLSDTLGFVVRRTINAEGQWVNVDTLFVTGFDGFEVPTVNKTSVTREDGTFSGMIAPILPMLGDTMTVRAEYKEGGVYIWDTVKILLQ